MRACSGVWIAHGSGSADREAVDAQGRVRVPPGEESYVLRRVWLTPEEEKGYYYGFSNEGLWPLCHIAHTRPIFRSEDWEHYQAVNQKFADAVCDEVDSDDPIVLVQDYHFALLPRMIRERLPRATVLTFWHIPWPNAERFGICPWRDELLEGLLGQQHPRLPHAVALQQLPRLGRPLPRGAHRPRAARRRPQAASGRWSAPTRSRSSGRAAGLETAPPVGRVPGERLRRARARARTRCSASASTASTTPRASRSGCWPSSGCSSAIPTLRGRFTFVQLAAPSRTVIARYQQLERAASSASPRASTSASARDGYRPIDPAARAPRAARRCSATTAPPTSATSAACTTA